MNYFDQLYAELHKSAEYNAEYFPQVITGMIRRYMFEKGITQEQLANRLDVSQANIAKKLRKGQNLTLKSMAEIVFAMNAEWAGIELISHDEAMRREKVATWPSKMKESIVRFSDDSKGLPNDGSNIKDDSFSSDLALTA